MYLSLKEDTQDNIRSMHRAQKQSPSACFQNEHKNVRIQLKSNRTNESIQCFPEESRTLTHEVAKIKKSINDLKTEMQLLEVANEFDEELWELDDNYYLHNSMNQTLHHILPRNAIRSFINKLDANEKKEILLEFVRFNPTNDSDVTTEEYIRILQGDQQIIKQMLERVLMSLRSNLTFGPSERSDDPKGKKVDFDPNYTPEGELDEISQLYQIAYDAIKNLNDAGDDREYLITTIRTSLREAERKLAEKQGITGDDAYKYAMLEPGDLANWVRPFNQEKWRKKGT